MHLSQAWLLVPGLARGDLSDFHAVVPSSASGPDGSVIRDMWDLDELNNQGVHADQERSPRVIADRIEARAEKYFADCAEADPDEEVPWIVEGTRVRRGTLTYNLLNETLIHTYDIAKANKQPFRMEPSHASMALGRFVVRALQANPPQTFVNTKKAHAYGPRTTCAFVAGIASISSSTTVNSPSTIPQRAQLTAISQAIQLRSCWWYSAGAANGRRSPPVNSWPGAASPGSVPSSEACYATHNAPIPRE